MDSADWEDLTAEECPIRKTTVADLAVSTNWAIWAEGVAAAAETMASIWVAVMMAVSEVTSSCRSLRFVYSPFSVLGLGGGNDFGGQDLANLGGGGGGGGGNGDYDSMGDAGFNRK